MKQKYRWFEILLLIFVILLVVLVIPTLIMGELIYSAPRSLDYGDIENMNEYTIETKDHVKIVFWSDLKGSSKAVLLVHGHFDHAALLEERYASIFRELGYNIVALDLRNHGRSDHVPPVTMGIEESLDVLATLNWMKQSWDEIVLFGTSMGSIAALLAHDSANIVDRLILDSSFHDPIEVMNKNFEKNYIIQPWRFLIVQYLTNFRFSKEFPEILSILEKIAIPTLVIHGSQDNEATPSFLLEVDNLENNMIETVMIKGGKHSRLHLHEDFYNAVNRLVEV